MPSSRPSTAAKLPTKVPLNGHFRNAIWHCNCQPRLPAVQFTVKADTKNRGRTFYTCQHKRDKGNQCDFFLWSEDARAREIGALMHNSRSEPETPKKQITLHESITPSKDKRPWTERTPITSIGHIGLGAAGSTKGTAQTSTLKATGTSTRADDFGDDGVSSGEEDELARLADASSQPGSTQKTPAMGSKRKRSDEEEYSDFSSGEEEQLAAITVTSSSSQSLSVSEGSQGRHRDVFATPATTRTHGVEGGMPTPVTDKPVRRTLFGNQDANSSKRQRTETGFASPHQASPTPSQPSSQQAATTPGADPANLTQDVMSLLKGQKIDEGVLRTVRNTLDKYAAKAKGLERGRDASREAVKKADGRVAQLRQKITDLENARSLDRETKKKTLAELMKIYEEN